MKQKMQTWFWPVLGLVLTAAMSWLTFSTYGQTASNPAGNEMSPAMVVDRGVNHRVWERLTYETLPSGRVVTNVHRYTELMTGMHYQEKGQWLESKEAIEVYPTGAIARQGGHKVIFANNLHTAAAIDMETPDGKELQSHILGLSYSDGNKSVLIAEVQDSPGQIVAPNQVIYQAAFTDFAADVRYTYTRAGFEQDIILRERPPLPEDFGLDSRTTRLQVLTEFLSPPQPVKTAGTMATGSGELPDETLDFGAMKMGPGKAFVLGTETETLLGGIPVGKQWLNLEERTILCEEVAIPDVAKELNSLPLPAKSAALKSVSDSVRHMVSTKRLLPEQPLAQVGKGEMKVAQLKSPARGFVLDYTTMSSQTNFTFQSDSTYFVSGLFNLSSNTTLEGGTVVKYANTNSAELNFTGPLACKTGPYRPAIFTASDDDSVGEAISGSSGNPSGLYAAIALNFNSPAAAVTVTNVRVSYATYGFAVTGNTGHLLAHSQFESCKFPVYFNTTTGAVQNVLIHKVSAGTAFNSGSSRVVGQNVTLNEINQFNTGSGATVILTNSLLVSVTNMSSGFTAGAYNLTNSGGAGTFQSVGAGFHYLAAGSTNRNAGTTNIDAALLAALRQKTTYPPVVYAGGSISTNLTLGLQATRDTNAANVDLGYHYDPLDYAIGAKSVSSPTITINPGTAIATFGTNGFNYGFAIISSGQFQCVGAPNNLNRIVAYNMVQERSITNWARPSSGSILTGFTGSPSVGAINCRFTDWSVPAQDDPHLYVGAGSYAPISLQDCQFHGGQMNSDVNSLNLTNCLLERVNSLLIIQDNHPPQIRNNLFRAGTFGFAAFVISTSVVKDNLFDQAVIPDYSGGYGTYDGGYNAFVTGYNRLQPTNINDVVLTVSPAYQTGSLGNYYLPTNSTLLLDKGSVTNAGLVGLFHYTTTTNQVKETNSVLDIGYHYAATAANGVPFDTDGDGTPDCLDTDADADGLPDAWEIQYFGNLDQTGAGDYDGDGVTNLVEYNAGSNPSVGSMVVAWGYNSKGQCNVPTNLTDALQANGGALHSVALRANGSVVAWGDYVSGQTNLPPGLTDAAVVASGGFFSAAVKSNGTVVVWGNTGAVPAVPADLTNATDVSVGTGHFLALRQNGTLVSWGTFSSPTNTPALSTVKSAKAGWYHNVAISNNGTLWAWGDNTKGQTTIPAGLTNVAAVAAAAYHSLALKSNGTVVAWGDNTYGQTNLPSGLSNVVAVAARGYSSMAARADGTVVCWGVISNAPAGLTGVVAIGAGDGLVSPLTNHLLAVRVGRLTPVIVTPPTSKTIAATNDLNLSVQAVVLGSVHYQWLFNGIEVSGATNAALSLTNTISAMTGIFTIVATNGAGGVTSSVVTLTVTNFAPGELVMWGANDYAQSQIPWWQNLSTNVIAAAGGARHTLALRENNTTAVWGANDFGQTNIPPSATNVTSVAAGAEHNLALREDGTVLAWGRNDAGQTNVPASVTNVIAISAGGAQSMALRKDGTVTNWGASFAIKPASVTNIIAIASGTNFSLALRSNGTLVAWGDSANGKTNVPASATNVVAIAAGGYHSLALRSNGTVVAWGLNTSSQTNVPAGLSNVMAVAAGNAFSLALKNDGSVVVWGDNTYGQTNVVTNLPPVKFIAAGANHSIAGVFSQLTQYAVDVSKDLLLIYNTNSLDSSNVCAYYLAHRPMVSNAIVLPIGCTNNDAIRPLEYTNTIYTQVKTWLTNNPTKRPGFVILFPDIPSQVSTNNTTNDCNDIGNAKTPSVQYRLYAECATNWSPFVTSINMGDTNVCKAYIDKLEYFGTNYSSGKLFISASAGRYENTNYVVDDVKHLGYDGRLTVYNATNGLLNAGVSTQAILYVSGVEITTNLPHLTSAANVAGYISWGAHSSLGENYQSSVQWTGSSRWWIIETVESFNGQRCETGLCNFIRWYSSNVFGGINYSNTPVGAVSYVEEPGLDGINDAAKYFGLWAQNKNFAICAWNSRNIPYFQVIGDPFTKR